MSSLLQSTRSQADAMDILAIFILNLTIISQKVILKRAG